jgi:hypothetical protein
MTHSPIARRRLAVPMLLAAFCGGGVAAFAAPAPAPTALITFAADRMAGGSLARPIPEQAAEGRRTMMLSGAVSLRGTARLKQPADHLTLRVRAKRCGGWPVLRVSVDGRLVLNRRIAFTRYRWVSAKRTLTAGAHRLTVTMTHAAARSSCRRRLYVDTVRLTTTAVVQPGDASGVHEPGSLETAPGLTTTTTTANTTTTTTTTTTGTVPGGGNPGGLRWAPPALVNPAVITVADGDRWYTLDKARDYIIKMPGAVHNGSLGLEGGRNVVLIGGHIRLPVGSGEQAALQLRDTAGTVHVEGLWFDGSSGYNADAIRISAPSAVVQIENVRASALRGSAAGSHTDVIQPYGGVRSLRVDRLTADSNYQGIFAMPDLGPIGSIDLSDVDLYYDDVAPANGGYLLWLSNGCNAPKTTLSNVYVKCSAAKTLGTSVWPNVYDGRCPAKVSGNTVSWPTLPITGRVTGGAPPGGAFVTAAQTGAAYASPGYR